MHKSSSLYTLFHFVIYKFCGINKDYANTKSEFDRITLSWNEQSGETQYLGLLTIPMSIIFAHLKIEGYLMLKFSTFANTQTLAATTEVGFRWGWGRIRFENFCNRINLHRTKILRNHLACLKRRESYSCNLKLYFETVVCKTMVK